MNNPIYSLIRFACFSLLLLDNVNTHKFEGYFVLFTFVNETLLFFKSPIGVYAILRYAIAMGFIMHYSCSRLTEAVKRYVGREHEPTPIFVRYWHSISKLASFIWPKNNVRLQLCLASCAILLILGRITALMAPIYGKKVGRFFIINLLKPQNKSFLIDDITQWTICPKKETLLISVGDSS